jgi:phosphohistidine phosphatase
MELYILRHGIAVERGTEGFADDSQRPLTADGRAKLKLQSQGMKRLDLGIDLVLTSPYVRAEETARIAASVLKIKTVKLTKNLQPEAAFKGLAREIAQIKHSGILLVGHEPHLSGLISFLVGDNDDVAIDLKKGGLCKLTLEKSCGPNSAVLNWLMEPSHLRLLAEKT